MKKKILLIAGFCFILSITLSGCFAKDIMKDVATPDEDKIIGDWYDENTDAYFMFSDNGTYQAGTGLYSNNDGGNYQLEDGKLILSIAYTVIDSQKSYISDPDQETKELSYEFDTRDNLIIHYDNTMLTLKEVESQTELESETPVCGELQGLYQTDDISYYFNKNGNVTRSFKTENKTDEGFFSQDGTTLYLTFDDTDEAYTYFLNNEQLVLMDKNGKSIYLTQVN